MQKFNTFQSNIKFYPIKKYIAGSGSNTLPRTKSKSKSPQSLYQPNVPPAVFIPKERPESSQQYDGSGILMTSNYQPYDTSPLSSRRIDFDNLQNYNTAPRGWGEVKNFYKPITFNQPKQSYSDF